MTWANKYVGIPFAERGRDRATGVDCWGLVRLVYAGELQVALPEWLAYKSTKDPEVSKLIELGKGDFVEVQEPQDFDIVVLNVANIPRHVGIVCTGDNDEKLFLHSQQGPGAMIESLRSMRWAARVESFWRRAS